MLCGGQNDSPVKSWPLHEMQFESISSPANTDYHWSYTSARMLSLHMWMQAMHLISLTEPTWLPAGKQTGLYFMSHLILLVPQANSGVQQSPWKLHQHCSYSADSGANSKLTFHPPFPSLKRPFPRQEPGSGHTWWYWHSLIAGMELGHPVMA